MGPTHFYCVVSASLGPRWPGDGPTMVKYRSKIGPQGKHAGPSKGDLGAFVCHLEAFLAGSGREVPKKRFFDSNTYNPVYENTRNPVCRKKREAVTVLYQRTRFR